MQIITSTPTSKATTALLNSKNFTSRTNKISSKQARRRSSSSDKKIYNNTIISQNAFQLLTIPANQNLEHQKQDLLTKATSSRSHHTPDEEKEELDFEIVYNAPTELLTPPPSPKSSPVASESFEANDRILTAKRHGQLKTLMSEYALLKKEGKLSNDHAYNLIFDSYASLRRDGTPLAPMLKIYDEMLRAQIQPSSSTYGILIRALCRRDVEVQKVIAMLKRQSARSEQRNKGNNMAELEAEENLQKALVIFEKAVNENLVQFFEVELYNQILRVLSHYGNTEKSLYVYNQLELHAAPTSATFAALINLFGRVGDLASALFYFNRYTELKDVMGIHDASYVYNALVDAHLKCHKLDGALKIVKEDMMVNDVKVTTIPYNSIIRYYCMQNQLDEVCAFIQSMKGSAPAPDASSYGPVLSAYCQSGLFKEATEMYQSLVQTDISKSYGNLANYALLCLKETENNSKVFDVISDMRRAGLEPDTSLAERIIQHFIQVGRVSQAIQALGAVLEAMKPRSLFKGMSQLKNAAVTVAEAAKGRFSQTLEVARLLQPHGLPTQLAKTLIEDYEFDTQHNLVADDYSLLFEAALVIAPLKTSLSPFHVFVFSLQTEMSAKRLELSPALHSRVLSHFNRIGDKKSARRWEGLLQEGFASVLAQPVSEEVSEAVMKAAIQGDLSSALEILQTRIVDAGVVPTPEPLRDAIAFVGKQGHLDEAVSMYRLAIESLKGNERALYMMTNSILIGYAQQGDMVNAKQYYEQIKSMGRYPDGNGYASLLLGSAKCATDEATDALTIYDEAKRRDVKPTTFFYNVVISKLAKARKLDAAMKLFEEMQHFKVMPNSITYGAIISACVRAGSEPLARKLFSDMMASPTFQPRVGPFNNMIQFYVRQQPDRERALEYFAEMRRRQIKPSPHTYKLLMEAYALIAPYDMLTAHRMLRDMERDQIRPQATHYATLIYSYGTLQRDVKSADLVFQDMKDVPKDEVVYQAMIDTLISNNQLARAEELYRQMDIQKSTSPYIENVFIRGYGEKGMIEKAQAMFDAMTDDKDDDEGVVREPSTYEAMVRAYVDNHMLDKAKAIFQLMVQREFPEKVTAVVAELLA